MDRTVPIRGMTCRACEVRVARSLRQLPGVEEVAVSAARGRARITSSRPLPRASLEQAVLGAGYALGDPDRSWVSRDRRVWRDLAIGLGVVALALAGARMLGLEELAGRVGASAGPAGTTGAAGLTVALVLGLAAGLSACMALVGGLVLAVAARHAERHPQASLAQRWRPHLAFNAGRVVGFTVLGAVLGAVGGVVHVTGGTLALLTLVVALAMVAIGVQLTAVSPRLAHLTPALPAGVATRLGLEGRGAGAYRDGSTAALGAASFLLPCGFTQVVQLSALATGEPVTAGLMMGLFALGTAPGLLGVGGLTAAARGSVGPVLLRVAGVGVLALAAVNVGGAVTVLAPGATGRGPVAAGTTEVTASLEDGVQVLRTAQVVDGYAPAHATVLAGTEVRWEIDSTAASCASALHAPGMGVERVRLLEPGANVVTFTPTEPGSLHYSCAMGMYTGVVEVLPAG
ncbi:sulfite exporter TauE/SafE family protein [Actinotalea sp. BY-33]|uniref:Sulfite exporter TauE/SafE family protein n=1 Tax=Actinotalea soli TaxID=2819234 RepID=A0A939LP15_9CELL|nr:sulfite exporter TauE/SafE family protein [Actinotalea soli]MBO1750993.1 sulfite exporter TauE/SafE family protein [Actinotalea soli]